MNEKTTSAYVRRRPRADEKPRIDDAIRVFEHALKNLRFYGENANSDVEITLRNKLNPNGFVISVDARGKPKVERFINLGWARKNGYVI